MKGIIHDFFTYLIKSQLCWRVNTRIEWSDFNLNGGAMNLKSFLSSYVKFYSDRHEFETEKLTSQEDYVWGSNCYNEEIRDNIIIEFKESERFWASCEWGFNIKAYYSSKLYFAPSKGLVGIIGDYAQLGFWEVCNVSGGILKFTLINPQFKKNKRNDVLNINECVEISLEDFKKNGVLVERIHYQNGDENEINHKMIESIIDFMRKKRDVIDILIMMEKGKISEVLDKWGTVDIPHREEPFMIDIDGNSISTNDVMVEYESLLETIHKNGLVETKCGKSKICDICSINDTPKVISAYKIVPQSISYNGLETSINRLINRLDFIADNLMEKGVIFNGGIIPVKNAVHFKTSLPFITQHSTVGENNVRLSSIKKPFKRGIRTGVIPFNVKSNRSALKYNFD